MVDNKRASSLSTSASSRKEKQSKSGEKDSQELIKGKLVRKTSSISSPSTPSKKGKETVSRLKETEHNELLKAKVLTRRASSLSSPSTPSRKGKQSLSCMGDSHDDNLKGKLTRRINSFSSSPTRKDYHNSNNESHNNKEKPVRKASLLSSSSSSSRSSIMREKSSINNVVNSEKSRKTSSLVKSKIKELGPICKTRKDVLNAIKKDEEIDVYLDKQIEGEGKINSNDCFWLSSGSMSPQEFGLFMSALDPSLDEFVLSFLPRSSKTPNAFDGSKVKFPLCEANVSGEVEEKDVVNEVNGSTLTHAQSIDSSSSLDMSTDKDTSSFWNLDRTGVWVSLINLNGEESKFISDVDSNMNNLESNFPSPSFEINWDSYSSDVGISSSAKSTTQESGSQSEWSSDLLSDSLDWEIESNDPIFWPFGVDCDWDQQGLDTFSVSPRRGVYKILNTADDSIRFRLHGKNGKRILFLSGLSASKMIDFKKGCRKNKVAKGKRFSKVGKRGSRYRRRVPPILENDLEGISPKESSTKGNSISSDMDLLSECTENWDDEMNSDGPLFWPNDQKTDWNVTWDSFQVSPRKGIQSNTNFGSPKNSFAVSSSVRLKFLPKFKAGSSSVRTGLSASKSFKFKSTYQKTNAASKNLVVVLPRRRRSIFKTTHHGKKKREMPLKVGNRSVYELVRLVSLIGMNKMFPGNEVTSSEELPIETLVGLDAFDGHEGFSMELEDTDFSLMEGA